MIGTWKVAEPTYPVNDPADILESVADVLRYLACPVDDHQSFLFWRRPEFDPQKSIKPEADQYWVNSILVSSIVAQHEQGAGATGFDEMLKELKTAVEKKLEGRSLWPSHKVVITRDHDYGDAILSVVRQDWAPR